MSSAANKNDIETASKLERNRSGRRIFFQFLRGMAIAIPIFLLIGIIALFAYENHVGEKAWLETKAKYEHQGLSFDLADFVPEMPPEEENFARCKVIRSLTDVTRSAYGDESYDDPVTRDAFVKMKAPKRQGNPRGSHEFGLPVDFNVWIESFQESERWNSKGTGETWTIEKMLDEMSAFDAQILALHEASEKRAYNQLPVEFGDTLFSHFEVSNSDISEMRDFCYFLRIRANLAIHNGDAEFALKSIQLMWRLADTVESRPEQINNLTAITIRWSAVATFWYGLENQIWNSDQLETFQTDFSTPRCITSMARAFNCEAIIWFSRGVEDFLDNKDQMASLGDVQIMDGSLQIGEYSRWFPKGWWDQNRAFGVGMIFENVVIPARDQDYKKLIDLPDFYPVDAPYPHKFYYNFSASSYDSIVERNLEVQTKINIAIAACAVERFKFANKRLPDSIAELRAANLGEIRDDFYNPAGGLIQYRNDSDNGRYLLYSCGTNQKDNGGTANSKGGRSPFDRVDKATSDIVWRYSSPKILKLKALYDSGKWESLP